MAVTSGSGKSGEKNFGLVMNYFFFFTLKHKQCHADLIILVKNGHAKSGKVRQGCLVQKHQYYYMWDVNEECGRCKL